MSSSSDIRAGGAYIEVFTKDLSLQKGLAAAEKKVRAFAKAVNHLGETISGWGKKLMAAGAMVAAPLVASMKVFTDLGDSLDKMSARTGVSVEALSELTHAAKLSGTDAQSLETHIRRMQRSLLEAGQGTAQSQRAFDLLGLSVQDLLALSPEKQFYAIADALAKVSDPTVRAGVAMEVFGRGGTALLPMLNNGSRGIEELRKRARDLGLTISTEDATAAAMFKNDLRDLWDQLKMLGFSIAKAVLPAMERFVKWGKEAAKAVKDWIKTHEKAVTGVMLLAGGLAAAGAAFFVLGKAISITSVAFSAISGTLGFVATGLGAIGTLAGAILSPMGLLAVGVGAIAGYFVLNSKAANDFFSDCSAGFNHVKEDGKQAFSLIAQAIQAGQLQAAFDVAAGYLRLEWTRLTSWLSEKWLSFKYYFAEVAIGMPFVWSDVCAKIETIWAEMIRWLAKQLNTLWNSWSDKVAFINVGLAAGSDFDPLALGRTTHEIVADENRKDKQKSDTDVAIDEDTARKKAEIERERKAQEQALGPQAGGAIDELHKERDREEKQIGDKLADAAANFARINQEAADEIKKAQEARDRELKNRMGNKGPNGIDIGMIQGMKNGATGTTNPFAIWGLIGSPSKQLERTAKATEETAKACKEIAKRKPEGAGQ